MRHEWMNEGQPLPAGHRKAGMIGVTIDFEDGRPEPQNVYAESKDALLTKILTMYGNTQVRNGELKAAATAQPKPAPAAPAPMTPDERIQTVADLDDPAKAPQALVRLIREETGIDLKAQSAADQQKTAAEREVERLQGEVATFLSEHPDYVATQRNAVLLRNSAFAIAQREVVTAAHFAQAYEQLQEIDALEAAPAPEPPPAATEPPEPLAPPAARPRASTGIRPSAFRGTGQAPTGPQMTRADVEAMAGTDDYAWKLAHEPGFMAKVEAALAQG